MPLIPIISVLFLTAIVIASTGVHLILPEKRNRESLTFSTLLKALALYVTALVLLSIALILGTPRHQEAPTQIEPAVSSTTPGEIEITSSTVIKGEYGLHTEISVLKNKETGHKFLLVRGVHAASLVPMQEKTAEESKN